MDSNSVTPATDIPLIDIEEYHRIDDETAYNIVNMNLVFMILPLSLSQTVYESLILPRKNEFSLTHRLSCQAKTMLKYVKSHLCQIEVSQQDIV
jgi:hypothetical protein